MTINPPIRELLCQACGREYPVWFAPNELWNRVCRLPDGTDKAHFLCMDCFALLAEEQGLVPTAWVLSTEGP